MRDQTDSRTLPLSLGKPARQRTGQSGAGFLPLLPPKWQDPNCDVNGRRVRKGVVIEWPLMADQARAEGSRPLQVKVERVRNGEFWHSGWSTPSFTPCCCVRVVNA